MKDFSLDTIEAQSETRLKVLTNKNIIPPKIINYSTVGQQRDSMLCRVDWLRYDKGDLIRLYFRLNFWRSINILINVLFEQEVIKDTVRYYFIFSKKPYLTAND